MLDKHNRNINYMRISLTDKCNLRCIYCMPDIDYKCSKSNFTMPSEAIIRIVKAAASIGISKIRYTGGEPLIYKDLPKLIYETSNIPNIKDVSITTNGMLLESRLKELIKAGLKRINISLDTLDGEKFKRITKYGSLQAVLSGINKCIEMGINPVKINTVLMKGINDNEIEDFIKMTISMPLQLRFIELMPIGQGLKYYDKCRISYTEVLEKHPELIPLEGKNHGTAFMYKLPNAKGAIGFINPLSNKFCRNCNKIRLTSDGKLKSCLHSEKEIDIKQFLNDDKKIIDTLKLAILRKPLEHHMEEENISRSKKMMYQVGG